jgi:hypothetical protein
LIGPQLAGSVRGAVDPFGQFRPVGGRFILARGGQGVHGSLLCLTGNIHPQEKAAVLDVGDRSLFASPHRHHGLRPVVAQRFSRSPYSPTRGISVNAQLDREADVRTGKY